MTGWNLPPGCNVSDLPGNTREDQEAEAAYEQLCKELEDAMIIDPITVDEEWYDQLVMFIMKKMGDAHLTGYRQAVADDTEAKQIAAIEKSAKEYWKTREV